MPLGVLGAAVQGLLEVGGPGPDPTPSALVDGGGRRQRAPRYSMNDLERRKRRNAEDEAVIQMFMERYLSR